MVADSRMVYVDHARLRFGRMLMSHMVADSHEELLIVAARIGVSARWLQREGTPDEHFDVCESMRTKAIGFGAVPVSSKDIVRLIHGKRALTGPSAQRDDGDEGQGNSG